MVSNEVKWNKVQADIFWGEIAPCDHVLQVYENQDVFIDALAGFVGTGINANEACIVIATDLHLKALEARLKSCGIQLDTLISENRYMPLNAEETLAGFMVNGWPDETLFMNTVTELLQKAKGNKNRKVRAFGEMVALLWAQGNNGATVQLEHLWNEFCSKETFCLFCAYPKAGFTDNINNSFNHICSAHSKMIAGSEKQVSHIFYKDSYQEAI